MFSLNKADMNGLRIDLIKNTTVVVTSRLLKYWLVDGSKGELFSQDFVNGLVFLLLAFVFYHLVVEQQIEHFDE